MVLCRSNFSFDGGLVFGVAFVLMTMVVMVVGLLGCSFRVLLQQLLQLEPLQTLSLGIGFDVMSLLFGSGLGFAGAAGLALL